VNVGSGVKTGSGVGEAGRGVGGIVAIEKGEGSGVGVAVWQAEVRRRHPMRRNFFMAFLIT
jgi:hypothetical protein